jgi:F-type H+-transporting ATPase subunit b
MQINGFTVIAQVINFLVLVWMLKRFLYQPVLNAIDERERKISSQLMLAEEIKAQAQKQKDDLKQKNVDFDRNKTELMNQAVAATEAERKRLLGQAAGEAEVFRLKQQKIWEGSQQELSQKIAVKTRQGVLDIAKRSLADLASVSLEQQTIEVFLSRLNRLGAEEQARFIGNFKTESGPIHVESAFEISLGQQSEIKETLDKILSAKPVFQFKVNPQLISGIQLTANGYQLAWSVAEYLTALEVSISTLVNNDKPITKSEAK